MTYNMKEIITHAAAYDPATVFLTTLVVGFTISYAAWSLSSKHGDSKKTLGYIKVPGLPVFGNIGLLSDIKVFPLRLMELIDKYRPVMDPPILELQMFRRGRLLISAGDSSNPKTKSFSTLTLFSPLLPSRRSEHCS